MTNFNIKISDLLDTKNDVSADGVFTSCFNPRNAISSMRGKLRRLVKIGMINPDHRVSFHTDSSDNIIANLYTDSGADVGFIRFNLSHGDHSHIVLVVSDDKSKHGINNSFWVFDMGWTDFINKFVAAKKKLDIGHPGTDVSFLRMFQRHFFDAPHVNQ